MLDIKGKNIIVVGGATGVGAQYVRDLVKQGVNKVAIVDVNVSGGEEIVKRITTEFGKDRVLFVKGDVTKIQDLEQAIKTVVNHLRTVDVIINSATILNEHDWENEIAVNINGVINVNRIGLRIMGKNSEGNGGTIINVASILGLSPLAGCPVYVATKHAVIGLARSYSLPYYYNKSGVRILTICPGVTDMDLGSITQKRVQSEEVGTELLRELNALPKQSVEHVSQAVLQVLKTGENGTIWVTEGGQPIYEVIVPTRVEMRKN